MDAKKILEVIRIYRDYLTKKGIKAIDFSHFEKPDNTEVILAHCRRMLDKMEGFISENRIEKTFRWLGFVQGCLWSTGQYSLENLKNHNRPGAEEKEDDLTESEEELIEAVADNVVAGDIMDKYMKGQISKNEALIRVPTAQRPQIEEDLEMTDFIKGMGEEEEKE